MWNSCDICSFIGSYFIHQQIYSHIKCVFNTWYSCVKCTNLCMNKFHMIFIIKSSHGKFVMIVLYSWLPTRIYHKNLIIWIFFSKYSQFGFCLHENPLYELNPYFSSWKLKIGKKFPQKKLCLQINEIIFTNVLYEHLSFIFGQTRNKTCIGWKHWSFGTWNVLSHVLDHHKKCFVLVVFGTWRWTI
jgi:hypothetical protein